LKWIHKCQDFSDKDEVRLRERIKRNYFLEDVRLCYYSVSKFVCDQKARHDYDELLAEFYQSIEATP